MSTARRFLAKVDYIVARTQMEPRDVVPYISAMVEWTGEVLALGPCKGLHGYRTGAELLLGGKRIGRMDWGGDAMLGWVRVDIPGEGCSFLDLTRIGPFTQRAQLRRCDPCVTFTDGSVTHEMVLAAYRAEQFRVPGAPGRPPPCRVVETVDDPWAGRTAYVGKRGGFKMARCYEKGLEVLQKENRKPSPDADPASVLVDGAPARDVYRIEVEFQAQGRESLPWDMVADPLGYWRGAYPWLASLIPAGERRPLTSPVEVPSSQALEAMLSMIKRQYGATLYTALVVHGGDIGAVFDKICGSQHSERLLRAGALIGQSVDSP